MDGWLISLSATIGIVAGGIVWGKLWRMRIRRLRREEYIEAVRPIGNRLAPYEHSRAEESSRRVIDLTELEGDDHSVGAHEKPRSDDTITQDRS